MTLPNKRFNKPNYMKQESKAKRKVGNNHQISSQNVMWFGQSSKTSIQLKGIIYTLCHSKLRT